MKDLIRSITENTDDYDEKYMNTKFNLDKAIEIPKMRMVVRAVF